MTSTVNPDAAPSSRSSATSPAPLAPNLKSLPTSTRAGAEAVDEHPAHEVLGALRGEGLVEGDQQGRVDAGLAQQLELLLVAHERRRALLGIQQGQRVAVEGHDDGGEALAVGGRPQSVDDGAVAGVHAVELADRDDGCRPVGRDGVEAVVDDHAAPRRCRGPRLRSAAVRGEPPQAEDRQHQRDEQVARAEQGPHRRGASERVAGAGAEQVGGDQGDRADDEHADELEGDRDPRDPVPDAPGGDEGDRRDDVDDAPTAPRA